MFNPRQPDSAVTQQDSLHQAERVCCHIVITGYVQGVGFRPFVYRLAKELNIKGYVANNSGQVSIEAVARRDKIDLFCQQLIKQAPPIAKPEIHSVNHIPLVDYSGFTIRKSQQLKEHDIHVLADLPVCDNCLEELFASSDRRYLYPFINCTQCGPRYSIITALPYDRKNTSMQSFHLCPECESEYQSPDNRRFHAEPVACDQCGPVLNYVDNNNDIRDNKLALEATIDALQQGKIIAIKDISGYHLVCDASNAESITLLRNRKQRPDKPFAVLIPQSQLEDHVEVSKEEQVLLHHSSRPIVVMHRNSKCKLPYNLAPGINKLGVMLPGNPLQYLICHFFNKPLVYTSGNISGEPIITANDDATKRLGNCCDAFLHHDRDIVRPADDPVMLHNTQHPQLLRTGRGLAPTEFTLPFTLDKPLLAVGGHIKNTLALAWENRMVISAHNGDLGNLRSYQTFQQGIEDLQRLYNIQAEQIICDVHPEYGSSHWATQSGLPVTKVFHHHAHASSLALEYPQFNNWLIFSWDGIGLGENGELWGGETFLGKPGHWKRVASFKPFRLPGGEKNAREAWRVAASLCWHVGRDFEIKNHNSKQLKQVWDKQVNSPQSSAVGRLFSAAAALLGLIYVESFEGHGPMLLEALAETAQPEPTTAMVIDLPLIESGDNLSRIDWRPLLNMLHDESLSKVQRAYCFHASLAECITQLTLEKYQQANDLVLGLSGGVFQNQLLLRLIREKLQPHNIKVHLPEKIPVNDGGLSAGQIVEYFYQ